MISAGFLSILTPQCLSLIFIGTVIMATVMILCCIGTYGANNRVFDVFTALLFGIIGFLLLKFSLSLSPIILGFILEPVIETNLMRGLMFSKGSFLPFVTNPISAVFLAIAILSVVLSARKEIQRKRAQVQS